MSEWVATDHVESDAALPDGAGKKEPIIKDAENAPAGGKQDPANMTFKPVNLTRVSADDTSPKGGVASSQDKMFDFLTSSAQGEKKAATVAVETPAEE